MAATAGRAADEIFLSHLILATRDPAACDASGRTALHHAALAYTPPPPASPLPPGSPPPAASLTPAAAAAQERQLEVVEVLLGYTGVDARDMDSGGATAAALAEERGQAQPETEPDLEEPTGALAAQPGLLPEGRALLEAAGRVVRQQDEHREEARGQHRAYAHEPRPADGAGEQRADGEAPRPERLLVEPPRAAAQHARGAEERQAQERQLGHREQDLQADRDRLKRAQRQHDGRQPGADHGRDGKHAPEHTPRDAGLPLAPRS